MADIEIVAWDSSLALFISKEDELIKSLCEEFPLGENYRRVTMTKQQLINNVFLAGKEIVFPVDMITKSYAIIYPTDGYYLSKVQHCAICESLKQVKILGETTGVDIEVGGIGNINLGDSRMLFEFEYSRYMEDVLLFENCVIDSNLRWSICIYQDYWGIIYGPIELFNQLALQYNLKNDLEKFNEEIIEAISDRSVRKKYEELVKLSYAWDSETLKG